MKVIPTPVFILCYLLRITRSLPLVGRVVVVVLLLLVVVVLLLYSSIVVVLLVGCVACRLSWLLLSVALDTII